MNEMLMLTPHSILGIKVVWTIIGAWVATVIMWRVRDKYEINFVLLLGSATLFAMLFFLRGTGAAPVQDPDFWDRLGRLF